MIKNDIVKSITVLLEKEGLSTEKVEVAVSEHADYSTNIAFKLGKTGNYQRPEEFAKFFVPKMKKMDLFSDVTFAQPGFINFTLKEEFVAKNLQKIIEQDKSYGCNDTGRGIKIQVEFVSANPTGPLTLGNGRGAFTGDALSNILEMSGFDIEREYYLNDRGNQVDLLGKSIANEMLREGERFEEEDLYKGSYIKELAESLQTQFKNPKKEYRKIAEKSLEITVSQTKDLVRDKLKVYFDSWFSEESMYKKELDKEVLKVLEKKKLVYKNDGTLWFRSKNFGDEKDRVLIKNDGESTYFLSDIIHKAYLSAPKFDKLILLLGADHHGYQGRLQASMTALDQKDKLDIIIFQLVRLLESGKEVRMSKRSGTFVTLEELIDEVGLDAARFFFNMYSANTPIDFDINLAKEQSNKNPVYYVQYAHARMNSILGKSNSIEEKPNWLLLKEKEEVALAKKIIQFPDIVSEVSKNYSVHTLTFYAIEIADTFHRFYEKVRVIGDDKNTTNSRLNLVKAAKITLRNCLQTLGVTAPERM